MLVIDEGNEIDDNFIHPLNVPFSIVVIVPGNEIEVKFVQFSNEYLPRVITLAKETLVNEAQFLKAPFGILVIVPCIDNEEQLMNELYPMLFKDWGRLIELNELQPLNDSLPIFSNVEGNEILDKFEQFSKELLPIFTTSCWIFTLDKFEHPFKAEFPITTVVSGKSIWLKDVQFSNALSPIVWTFWGIFIDDKELQSCKKELGNSVISCGKVIEDNELHPLQTPSPNDSTFDGKSIWVKFEHFSNANSSIFWTDCGIDKLDKPLQPLKAETPIEIIEEGIWICWIELQFRNV